MALFKSYTVRVAPVGVAGVPLQEAATLYAVRSYGAAAAARKVCRQLEIVGRLDPVGGAALVNFLVPGFLLSVRLVPEEKEL